MDGWVHQHKKSLEEDFIKMTLDEQMQKKLRDINFCESVSTNPDVQRDLYLALNEDEQPDNFWFGSFSSAADMHEAILKYYEEHPEELDE